MRRSGYTVRDVVVFAAGIGLFWLLAVAAFTLAGRL